MRRFLFSIDEIKSSEKYSLVGGPFGSNLTSKDYVQMGVPVIRGANLSQDYRFIDENFVFVTANKADSLISNTAYPGDIIFTQRGTLGQVGMIPDEPRYPRYIVSQSQMKLTVDKAKADAKFIYYLFCNDTTVESIKNMSITSGVPHINLGILKAFKICLPPIGTQILISNILGNYDDLIENNAKRIKLLENSVEFLYHEWFILLRFPGHEHSYSTTRIPKDWEPSTLGKILTLKRGYDLPESLREPGNFPIVSSSGITGLHSKKMAIAPGVVTGRYGTIGKVYYINQDYWPLNTALYVQDFKGNDPLFIYYLLKQTLNGVQSDKAAVPGVNRNVLHMRAILWPPKSLREAFCDFARENNNQIRTLELMNEKLRAARDLLLPRLMSGEISV
jgi:type I restriction enzyme S subunit